MFYRSNERERRGEPETALTFARPTSGPADWRSARADREAGPHENRVEVKNDCPTTQKDPRNLTDSEGLTL
jgi:hypothetical protein